MAYRKLGTFVNPIVEKNTNGNYSEVLGVSINKEFMPSVANIIGTDLTKYNVVRKNRFAFNPMHVGRDKKLPIAIYHEDEPALVSPAYNMFEITDENVDKNYLMLVFKTKIFDHLCWFYTDASVRGGLSWNDFANIEINIPSKDIQKNIVEKYKKIENRINNIQELKNNLIDIALNSYNNMIMKYSNENAEIISIGEYADLKSGFAFKSDWWINEGVPTIKIGNIMNNTINMKSCDYVSEEHAKKAKDFSVKKGDLLIAMTGATTGKIGIISSINSNCVVNQRVGKFFLGENPLEKLPFLFCVLNSNEVSYQIHPNGEKGSAQDNLSPDDIKNIKIKIPPRSVIKEFNSSFTKFFNLITIIEDETIILNEILENIVNTI